MKRYCLTPKGKVELLGLALFVGLYIVVLTVISMVIIFDNTSPIGLRWLGLAGWGIMLSFGAIYTKRWIQDNTEEC